MRQLFRFSAIGTAAFVVDTAVLYFARDALGLGLYTGRLCSYLVAATFTWALNRRFTFEDTGAPKTRQWLQFLAANAIGGVLNYATYAVLTLFVSIVHEHPVFGVAAGSLVGLTFNFAASRAWVFRRK
jgi:putative flippase GtrA